MAISQEQIAKHFADLQASGLSGDALYQRLYDDAKKYGVNASQLASATGLSSSDINSWISSKGLGQLGGGGAVTPATNPVASAITRPANQFVSAIQHAASQQQPSAPRAVTPATNPVASAITGPANQFVGAIQNLQGPASASNPWGSGGSPPDSVIANRYQELQNQGLQGDQLYQQLYDEAQQYGVSVNQLAGATGLNKGDINAWTQQQGLQGLAGSGLNGNYTGGAANPNPGGPSNPYQQPQQPSSLNGSQNYSDASSLPISYNYDANGNPQTGLKGAELAIGNAGADIGQIFDRQLGQQYGVIGQGLQQGRQDLQGGLNAASSSLSPYFMQGLQASQLQQALSGVSGPEAQSRAFANFQSSPEQQYLRDQSEKAITRNAAAVGGLGGGNVLKALQENAAGLASQDYGSYYNRIAQQAGVGQSAASQLAGLQSGAGTQQAQLGMNAANTLSGNIGNIGNQSAGYRAGMGDTLAANRWRAGQLLGQNAANQGNALANLSSAYGAGLANMLGGYGQNIGNLAMGAGTQGMNLTNQLSSGLGNISSGQATAYAGMPQRDVGNTGVNWGSLLSGVGTALGSYYGSNNQTGNPYADPGMVP